MEYIFPFSTCEVPQDSYIKQPYSVAVNILTVFVLIYFFTQTQTNTLRYVFFAFILLQVWHGLSHAVFLQGHIQEYVIHILAYNIAFSALYAILILTKTTLSNIHILLICVLVIIDLYIAYTYGGITMIISGFMLFTVILFTFYLKYPVFAMYFILAVGSLLLLIINEAVNCKEMLDMHPNFPFHIIIESYGFILFCVLGMKLLSIESIMKKA